MAAQNYAQISAALGNRYKDTVVRTLLSTCVLLAMLRVAKAESHQVHGVAEFDDEDHAITPAADGDDSPDPNADVPVAYGIPFAIYPGSISIGGLAQSLAGIANNPGGLRNLFKRQLENEMRRIGRKLNEDLYSGNDASPISIQGFDVAFDDTVDYGDIDRTTYPDWKGIISANGGAGRNVTDAIINNHLDAVGDASGEVQDLAFCDTAQWRRVAALVEAKKEFQQSVDSGLKRITFKGGHPDVLMWGQTLFVKDPAAPAGKIYTMNSQRVWIESVEPALDPQGDPKDQMLIVGDKDVMGFGNGASGVSLLIQKLGKKGWKHDASLHCALQLHVERPNACGIIKDLNS